MDSEIWMKRLFTRSEVVAVCIAKTKYFQFSYVKRLYRDLFVRTASL